MNTVTFLSLMANHAHHSEEVIPLINQQSAEIKEAMLNGNAEQLKKQLSDNMHSANMCQVTQP